MYDSSKLSELSQLARAHAGSTVMDVWPGSGDWTRLFSDIVGPEGRVYSFVPSELAHFKSDPVGHMRALAKEPGRENVRVISTDLVALPEILCNQRMSCGCTCSTTISTPPSSRPEAQPQPASIEPSMSDSSLVGFTSSLTMFEAATGTGTSRAESLHRIEPAVVREEVETAGFVLDAESTTLANKDDPHSTKVFDPSIKGETDRFAYRFVRR